MGSQHFLRVVVAACVALTVSACGGGGNSGDATILPVNGGDPVPPGGQTVTSLNLLASTPQLSSNAQAPANGVTLTAIARDAGQNVVPGATVAFSTTDSALIAAPIPATTDANGQVQAVLTTGGDPQNRTVTVSATSGAVTSTVTIGVVGTVLTISGPDSGQINAPVQFTALLVDSGGVGIAGRTVSVSSNAGNTLSAGSLTTDSAGTVTFTLTPTVANSFVEVSALGQTARQTVAVSTDQFRITTPVANTAIPLAQMRSVSVQWLQGSGGTPVPNGTRVNFAATRGTLTPTSATTTNGVATVMISSAQAGESVITASSPSLTMPRASVTVQFVATVAATVDVQADPAVIATNGLSNVSAIVRDPSNNLVANRQVEFALTDTSGGTISSSTATTNNLGIARITYNASSITTAADGVRIDATARNGDGSFATNLVRLTVGARALRIILGTGNEILEPNETVYDLPYSAIVTDAAGNPAPDASFNLSAFPLRYFKGRYVVDAVTGEIFPQYSVPGGCPNEDLNRNGILDAGEDANNNGRLEPGNVATVPRSPALSPDGTVQFNLRYPQDRGNWITLELRARAAVSGTEATEIASFRLPISEDDADNPPGPVSPYGVAASCSDPN